MSDIDIQQFGLGAIPSPEDERDYPIEGLYALTGREKALVIPASYTVPTPAAPVLDQGTTPQCVAFSTAAMKVYQDTRDTGPFDPDEALFFAAIGGGPNGAVVRNAFDQLVKAGYPEKKTGRAALHKIGSYWRVPVTLPEFQAALMAFGPIVVGMSWLNSMFRPASNGVLTCDQASGIAGGHAIYVEGWIVIGGQTYLIPHNSWGASWGINGRAYLPVSALSLIGEAWKAQDVIETPAGTLKVVNRHPDVKTATVIDAVRLIDCNGVLVIPTPRVYRTIEAATIGGRYPGPAHSVVQDGQTVWLLDRNAVLS